MNDCPFDPLRAHAPYCNRPDSEKRRLPAIASNGAVNSYAYKCDLCGSIHWCVPAGEIQGVGATHAETAAAVFYVRQTLNPGTPPPYEPPCNCMMAI